MNAAKARDQDPDQGLGNGLAGGLAHALDRRAEPGPGSARSLVLARAAVLDAALARARADDHARVLLTGDLDAVLALVLALAADLARVGNLTSHLTGDRAGDPAAEVGRDVGGRPGGDFTGQPRLADPVALLDLAIARARNLDRVLTSAVDFVLASACASDLDRSLVHELLRALDRAFLGPVVRVVDLTRQQAAGPAALSSDQPVGPRVRPVGRSVRTVVAVAVQVLPAAERPRWSEEVWAELADMEGWRRFPYVVRWVSRAGSLRRGVRVRRTGPAAIGR
jgi:hypothetical protein